MKSHDHIAKTKANWQTVKLSASSRARITENLRAYAEFHAPLEGVKTSAQKAEPGFFAGIGGRLRARFWHGRDEVATGPVRGSAVDRSIEQVPQRTRFTHLLTFTSKRMTAGLIALVLLLSGGTSYAAEGAVPGDVLYPVKVDVNERVQSAFAVSDAAEAKLQAHLAEERLHEAETLAARGQLSSSTAAELGARVKTHYDAATEHSDKVKQKGDLATAAEVRSNLAGSFDSYANILTQLNHEQKGNDATTLIANLHAYTHASNQAEIKASSSISRSDADAVAKTVSAASDALDKTRSDLSDAKANLQASVYAHLETQLNSAASASVAAKAALDAGAYDKAYADAQQVFGVTHAVQVQLASALRIKAELKVHEDTHLNLFGEGDTNEHEATSTKTEANHEHEQEHKDDAATSSDEGVHEDGQVELHTRLNASTSIGDTHIKTDTEADTRANGKLDL